MVDNSRFAPHYPYGSDMDQTEQSVLGVQWLNINGNLMNYTQSIHAADDSKMRSGSGGLAFYRVNLNWLGFHFLTAYVEANITKGGGVYVYSSFCSIMHEKQLIIAFLFFNRREHPMWAIVPRHNMLGRMMFSFCNTLFVPFLKEVISTMQQEAKDDGV